MNEAPRGSVRRSADGALLVREFRGDKLGCKLVPSQSEHCVFFGDHEIDPLWLEWPISGAQKRRSTTDNIRRAQGAPPEDFPSLSSAGPHHGRARRGTTSLLAESGGRELATARVTVGGHVIPQV